ncbi:MAG: branched-chain amino acid ABC transporter permease [Cellulomonas sp.]|uniref:Branched-chain amino acid ABC transporter permease n=1 Tax=Cellulomonas gelida TaxID=1712 RepID=A0A4Y3KII6_9CELL|nr:MULTISPECIES: branched-chain amino acid ABC transporter permease [Cellulomonas]KMM46814.1 branched-chain amino acid ABC transporter permease [Cellulomonas sp. A375-1]MCR6647518.1 branched-chain amino acid ABC transporter permease [Cellulomonas sp.]MCR6703508.1 branched-chain amino acid ABC transporter permease [Cellulomonas sp.]GEA84229.1 branched-chain amino acid ABC transporter permease [Cellulomonas gelida]GGL36903.1 branched-chain amino acid ABC transporter permease [Cellulomonas gelida
MDWTRILINVAGEAFAPATAAYALAAIGLNIHFGMTGLLNFGQAGFMLLGAYAYAITAIAGWPFFASVIAAMVAAVLFGILLGIPTLKLRGDYLSIVTIAAAEIVRIISRSTSLTWLTGGNSGLSGGDGYKSSFESLCPFPDGTTTIWLWTYPNCTSSSWWLRLVAWVAVAIGCVLVWRWMRSPWGRVLKGVREDEDAVRALGKNVYGYKMQALVLGGIGGAIAGIFYTLPTSVQADAMGRTMTFNIWTILLLGGAATVFGPVLGSILLWTVFMLVKSVLRDAELSFISSTQSEAFSWMLVGLTLMLLVIFRPQGILGDKKELAIDVR